MTPRTTSPPTYSPYDDLNDFDTSGPSETSLYNTHQFNPSSISHHRAPTTTTATTTARSNSHRSATTSFAALFLRPLNLPTHVSTIQAIILVMVYSFCITTLCFIFCTSYILTFYDDTKRIVGTSRVWARVKNGVRERLSMMGEDWEEFAKKYFDTAGLDHNTTSGKNAHLGGNQQQTNNHNSKSAEWEEWMKGMMFGFVSFVAGQDVTNRFQRSSTSFKFQRPFANGAASDETRK